MARRLSDETKKKRKMGTGEGKDYIPYITTSEFNSRGTTSVIKDWKDIREQYPLDVDKTVAIAEEMGIQYPRNKAQVMTTDFLVTEADGTLHAYSVKSDEFISERKLQLLCIEKMYWNKQGIKFDVLLKRNVNKVLAHNIRLVTEFYDSSYVFDWYSAFKHKIAIKELKIDIEHAELTADMARQIIRY